MKVGTVTVLSSHSEGWFRSAKVAVYQAKTSKPTELAWGVFGRELHALVFFIEQGSRFVENIGTLLFSDHKNLGASEPPAFRRRVTCLN